MNWIQFADFIGNLLGNKIRTKIEISNDHKNGQKYLTFYKVPINRKGDFRDFWLGLL